MFLLAFSSLVFAFNSQAIAARALKVDQNSVVCPYLGTLDCPLTSDYLGNASSKPENVNLNDCPLSGTPECLLIQDCCKNK
jgi:hypothetical protein